MLGETGSETDHVPMEWWVTKQGAHTRDRISFLQFKHLLVSLVKFSAVSVLDLQNTLSPDEIVDEWLELTFPRSTTRKEG